MGKARVPIKDDGLFKKTLQFLWFWNGCNDQKPKCFRIFGIVGNIRDQIKAMVLFVKN